MPRPVGEKSRTTDLRRTERVRFRISRTSGSGGGGSGRKRDRYAFGLPERVGDGPSPAEVAAMVGPQCGGHRTVRGGDPRGGARCRPHGGRARRTRRELGYVARARARHPGAGSGRGFRGLARLRHRIGVRPRRRSRDGRLGLDPARRGPRCLGRAGSLGRRRWVGARCGTGRPERGGHLRRRPRPAADPHPAAGRPSPRKRPCSRVEHPVGVGPAAGADPARSRVLRRARAVR